MAATTIDSWDQLQKLAPALLERVNADQALALAAATNPIIALEELGYEIHPSARTEIEDRFRLGAPRTARRRQLRGAIERAAGHPFNPDDPEELQRVLGKELGLKLPPGLGPRTAPRAVQATTPGPPAVRQGPPPQAAETRMAGGGDPLEALRGAHPVIEPLLEYRRLGAAAPQFAPRHVYEAVRQGKRSFGVTTITARLKAEGGPQPDVS
jgi:hypothetical protein